MRLLIIEDEPRIVEILTAELRKAGFAVDAVHSAARGDSALQLFPYDAVILDLGLPDRSGLTVLDSLRAAGASVPVLILTAMDAVEDRVRGLDRGADDYLVKPFAAPELVSRVKALLRRPGGALGNVLTAGNLTLDTVGRDVRIEDRPVTMSRREVAVLEHLMRRAGRVVPREVLEEKLYGMDHELESNAVPVHIHHLRRKLESHGSTAVIHTVRGIGYLLAGGPP